MKKYKYILSAVVYIPSDSDPFKEERLKEVKRIKELYQFLKKNCRKVEVYRTGLFGATAIFKECTVEMPSERGDLYTLLPEEDN